MIEAKGTTGTMRFDGQFVTIIRSGMARMTLGKGDKRVSLRAITAVQWKPSGALVNGYIELTIPGGMERQSRAGSATLGATKNENAVVFTRRQEPAFARLRAAIETALASTHSPPPAGPSSVADELSKLGELVQRGVLSPEEFAAQKARLLG